MAENKTVRVAAVQFSAGTDVNDNLKTALRMLDEAAKVRPDLVVLPEFSNHLSWYDDKQHCHDVSVALDGPWLKAVGAKAREHRMHVVVNCTVQRDGGLATGTSVLFGRDGSQRGANDKQVLIGHENDFLENSTELCPIIETDVGRIGMYACMDGVIYETPRGVALMGAQILANSLNSFALDEAALHIPVRAPENRVFIVAANKIGPLLPEALMEPVSQQTSIPTKFLCGAGESQIVAPDGTVLAQASADREEVVYADIDPTLADDKRRPDGTDVFASRRPQIYSALAEPPPETRDYPTGARSVEAAVYQPESDGEASIAEVVNAIRDAGAAGVQMLTLPEMFCFHGSVTDSPESAAGLSDRAVEAIRGACEQAGDIVVATSLVNKAGNALYHAGMLIDRVGIMLAQGQLHPNTKHPWTKLVDRVKIEPLEWGRICVLAGDDSLYPEAFRLAALQNCEVAAVPFSIAESWEARTGLLERSAENRLSIVAATRPGEPGASVITTLWEEYTMMTPWKTRPFDGTLSHPIVHRAEGRPGLTRATIHPAHARNKQVSLGTHVLDGRPWQLAEPLVRVPE